MLNKYGEAVKAYLTAISINSKQPECYFNLASAYNDMNDPKNAEKYYKKALDIRERLLEPDDEQLVIIRKRLDELAEAREK